MLLETLVVAAPGTIAAAGLAALLRIIVGALFSRVLRIELAFAAWPVAILLGTSASMAGGVLALPRAVRDGMIEALSYGK